MEKKPRVVFTRTRHPEASPKSFTFTRDMLPVEGISDYRLRAWDTFNRLAFPTTREEAWRRTNLHSLPADQFRLPFEKEYERLPAIPKTLLRPLITGQHGGQVVMLPGGQRALLDPALEKKGVIFTDLGAANRGHSHLVSSLAGMTVQPEESKFAALAGALAQNGILLYVPKGLHIKRPLHSILWGPGAYLAYLSHILIFVDEGASVTYVHESASPDLPNAHTFHAGIVEVKVAEGASLRFIELQSWGHHVWNFTHERVQVMQDGNLDWIYGVVGSRLTKSFSDLDLIGEGATGRISGFYFADGMQHLDLDTQQNHLVPHTTSDLLYKGALKGSSRSVWQGMIYVAPGAQKTDGYQANRNLVLSPGARADSIPGLEILADDVRCTHGTTVGKLEEEPLFYLKSRGIPEPDAQRLMVEGFFDPIMQRIPYGGVRGRFQEIIRQKLVGK
jgi:Fe-S cluster assembly protein SufD